jgi:5-dehydro-4-deoxyglucarate dehydratase
MMTAERLREGMQSGLMSFPLTPFTSNGAVDLEMFRQHLRRQLDAGPGAIFPCCGTGEFFSLSEEEYAKLIEVAVDETDGAVPVVAGIGYGYAQAAKFAAIADAAGADAGLVLPHYLVAAPQAGLVQHVCELAGRSPLPLVIYQRDNVKYSASSVREIESMPTVIGVKDGHGDLDQLQRLRLAVPNDFLFFNGTACAEMQARAFSSIGIPAYSSAVHCYAPEIAVGFFRALHSADTQMMELLLGSFFWPLVELRDRCEGYAVSLTKAGARLRGEAVGSVRAPLVDPTPDDLSTLERLIRVGLECVDAKF